MLIFEELFVPLHPSFYVITMEMLEKILIKQMRLVMLIALMAMTGVLNAQILSNNQVLQQKDSAFFQTQESRRIGDQLLLYQRDTGGVANHSLDGIHDVG